MCKAIAILLAVLLFTPALFAKGNHDWKHVEKLKPGSTVLISTWNGRLISGSVDAVGPAVLRIDTADPEVGVGSLVRRVQSRRDPKDCPHARAEFA
jgi:hypothetical protein